MALVKYPLVRVPALIFGPRRDPLGWLEALAREGDLVHISFPTAPVYYAFHPDIIRECLSTKQSSFQKGRGIQRARLVLGLSTLTVEGEEHIKRRRALLPLFQRERLNSNADAIIARACEHSARWHEGKIIDLANEMHHLAFAIASQVFLGVRANEDEIARASEAMSQVVNMFGKLMLPWGDNFVRLPLPSVKRFFAARDTLRALARRAYLDKTDANFQSHVCPVGDTDKANIKMGEGQIESVVDELVTLLIAGHETTALMLTWAIYLLSQHPSNLEKARSEIEMYGSLENLKEESFARMSFVRGVLAETLRLYPPVWGIGRRAIEDVALGSEMIPRGAFVTMSPWVMHRDARFYSAPLSFRPERWENYSPPSYAYIPFGGGGRRCIGEGFAWMEGALILATLLPRWNFEQVSTNPDVKPGFTLHPRTPILMRLGCRNE